MILHSWLHSDLQRLRLPSKLDIAALLTFLRLELLEHARAQLLSHHLVLAVALPFPLGRLDHILVPCHLQHALQELPTAGHQNSDTADKPGKGCCFVISDR